MKKLIPLSILIAVSLTGCTLLTSCAHYKTARTLTDPVTGIVKSEQTSVTTLLVKGDASKISSKTVDGDYSRTLSVGTITGTGDTATVESLGTAIGNGMKAAAGGGIPGLP